jgi:hypothetical protein
MKLIIFLICSIGIQQLCLAGPSTLTCTSTKPDSGDYSGVTIISAGGPLLRSAGSGRAIYTYRKHPGTQRLHAKVIDSSLSYQDGHTGFALRITAGQFMGHDVLEVYSLASINMGDGYLLDGKKGQFICE